MNSSPSFTKPSDKDADLLTIRVLRPMMWIISILLFFGLIITVIQPIANRLTSLLLALACLLIGGFVGFLFGIPRVLQSDVNPIAPSNPGETTNPSHGQSPNPSNNSNSYRQQVNTNLEQISDWLTKIIVGLGLVNLSKIPDMLRDTSLLIAKGIASSNDTSVVAIFANSVILYFPILGFMVGYLLTRIFLSDVFRKADTVGLMVGGQNVQVLDVVKNLVNVVTDSKSSEATTGINASSLTVQGLPKRILWVDDNPRNNVIEREILNKAGIEVVAALSTKEALELLAKSPFDLIISDMGRDENGMYNASAGVLLLNEIKNNKITPIRTVIYCSKQGAELYGVQARQAGADDVLQGPDALMKAIGIK